MTNSSFFDHFDRHFSTLSDPRFDRKKQHSLRDILLLTILGVICGAESWTDIELFDNARRDDLKDVLLLPNGVPSHDTLGRVFSLLNPKQLEASFLSWINSLVTISHGELIAIDGKTLRRSHHRASGVNAIHMVSAWVTDQIEWLQKRHPDWADLHSIGMIESMRQIGDKISTERRFYIGSGLANATEFLDATRRHWAIENQLHWVLDVSFNEDQCRVRLKHAAENLAVVRHIAINLLKQEPSKLSIRAKRRKAGWNHEFLCKILTANKF